MAPRRRDTGTLDLFRDFEPKPVVERFEESAVRASTLHGRISRAVARTLADDGRDRKDIARDMSEFLGEDVSVSMLNAYASQAKDEHRISAARLVALVVATGDVRPLNALLGGTGHVVVPERYEALIRREMAREARERLDREIEAADAQWRARR